MKNMIPKQTALQLTEILGHEINVLREILASIIEEKNAIVDAHRGGLEYIIDNRLKLLELLEPLREDVHQIVVEIVHDEDFYLSHEGAIAFLQEHLDAEDLDLDFSCNQVLSLLKAIHRENHSIEQLLGQHLLFNREAFAPPPSPGTQVFRKEMKKMMLGLLEPDSEE